MSDVAELTVAGELVVRNGKHKGSRVPLGAAATLIGSGPACDVRLTGPGVADVHCLIAVTPAGLALRSWEIDHTLVNGRPTAAELLRHGDELRVGPCIFQIEWHVEDFVPLTVAPPEPAEEPPVELWVAVPDELWDIHEQRRALHEQEAELAARLDERQTQLAVWYEELRAAREEVRRLRARESAATAADRAKARHMRDQTDRLRRAAREDRLRARAVYARFLKRLKLKWAAERQEIGRLWAELDAARDPFVGEVTRFRAEAADYQKRMTDAWDLLTDGQRRLLADRQQAEQTFARREEALDEREADLANREHTLSLGRRAAEHQVHELRAEIARLEHRAAAGRSAVQKLEEMRTALEGGPAAPDRIALVVDPAKSAEELLAELSLQHRDIARERTELTAARRELERRAGDLFDQRAVVAEQVAAVAVARRQWQVAECRTLEELEEVARGLAAREQQTAARELELTEADRIRRKRAHELWELRQKLEAWQAALAVGEATASAARDRAEAGLTAKREHLQKWEAALATLCRKWSAVRAREARRLREEFAHWAADRTRFRLAQAEADDARTRAVETAIQLGREAMAVEQMRQELTAGPRGPLAERRLRVLRRRWETHFGRFRKDVDARRAALAAETAAADERYRTLARLSAEVTERAAAVSGAEQVVEAKRLARERELEERAATLSAAWARADRTDRELAAARGHADEIAAALLACDPPRLPAADANPMVLAIAPRAA